MTTAVVEKSSIVASRLVKSGMRAKGYERGPLGKDLMALRIAPVTNNGHHEGVRVWTGLAECDVTDIAKPRKQAILAVDEQARTVTRNYQVSVRRYFGQSVRGAAREAFPVTMPGRPKFKLESQKALRDNIHGDYHDNTHYLVTGSMTVAATEMTLLLGIDETSHFICALPERVATVDEAHEVLRPAEVPAGSLRQGEWFFVPATQDEIDAVYRHIADGAVERALKTTQGIWMRHGGGPRLTSYAMEQGSSHHGLVVNVPEVGKFALGIIKDQRTSHHKELVLPTWHKVVRNTEVVFREPQMASQQTRTWD